MASRTDPLSNDFQYEEWLRKRNDAAHTRHNSASLSWHGLSVFGYGSATDYQKTFANYPGAILRNIISLFTRKAKSKFYILKELEGELQNGEMLLVLGRPGSGCSTFLKTIAGETRGFEVGNESLLNYQGIDSSTMHSKFRGESTYHAESDVHIAHLTVGQTLMLPTKARAPGDKVLRSNMSRMEYVEEKLNATLSTLCLRSVVDTKIGDVFVPGVSGGERRRAGIAEIMVGESSFQCWDNSTRGLDSVNAMGFLKTVRQNTRIRGSIALVTLYQASQDMYNIFDKVILLYEGREIFFGEVLDAKRYFVEMGFVCSDRTTTGDFLTSITNPVARIFQPNSQASSLRSSQDFADVWKKSVERSQLLEVVKKYNDTFPLEPHRTAMRATGSSDRITLSNSRRSGPYTASFSKQIQLCMIRGLQRLQNDLETPLSAIFGNLIMSLILGSMFYNMSEDTNSFFGRGALLFFTILLNTFLGAFEGVSLWETRPVVEKHYNLALYRPSAEAISSMLCDLPNKILLTLAFNLPFYFLANLRRTPSAFFVFYLFAFASLVAGSMVFRTIGALSTTLTGSIAPGAVFIGALVIYTGFVVPIPDMHPWLGWIRFIDPIAYAFESLMINEFANRQFKCSHFIPSGPSYSFIAPSERMCSAVGAVSGVSVVEGSAYLATAYHYYPGHEWRNLAIILSMAIFLCCVYVAASEWIPLQGSKGEILLFPKGHHSLEGQSGDEESQRPVTKPPLEFAKNQKTVSVHFEKQADPAPFIWNNLTYDMKTKKGLLRLLSGIQGWVEQGNLTAVMGSSGAGKTTLLNVLANRAAPGVVGGEIIKGDHIKIEHSFARKVAYAQQADIHLPTSTVREALELSAILRQSELYTPEERLAYVSDVIELLDMKDFVDAVVGVPGEGLNVEQRKKLTIGVELAVRSEILLFLDEPTSGLDSNTAWAICKLLRNLSQSGQAILCTIHQPSGDLFQIFDKLLLLSETGEQIYFGNIGHKCKEVMNYFESHGARHCEEAENPAEWLLEVTKSSNSENGSIWADRWNTSEAKKDIEAHLRMIKHNLEERPLIHNIDSAKKTEYARGFLTQLHLLTKRNLVRDWRTPSYLYSKSLLIIAAGVVNGFSFWRSENTIQGVQNQIFSCFLLLTLFSNVVQLIMPQYIGNRELYEARERPSKIYSWQAFVLSNTIAELPWQTLLAVILFVVWYYPIGMSRSMPAEEVNERSLLVFLFIWSFMIFTSTFSQLVITALPGAALGVNIASLLYSLSLIFCGVLVSPSNLPAFWLWMLRCTPLTYMVGGIVSTGISRILVSCSMKELVHFDPPNGMDCITYLAEYVSFSGATIVNPAATRNCQLCPISNTDTILGTIGIHYENRWRNLGITFSYSLINILGALVVYWLFRLPKRTKF